MSKQETGLGARITARREQLGLTRETVAELVGSAPGYLRYVEEGQVLPSTGLTLRLAHALDTTADALTAAWPNPSPHHTGGNTTGSDSDTRTPRLELLSRDECRALLPSQGIGRLAIRTRTGPAIIPLNYLYTSGNLAYRTAPGSAAASAAEQEVVFEVDHVDETSHQGWSINIVGVARAVTGDAAARGLDQLARTMPWAGGGRRQWLSIVPIRMTGRRIELRATAG
ncbi:helix-turn-helix domain-containing protein [Streptomyces sp. NBC_01429]|uniref:helix-turn-helix domain-containing protein n=1 Tax=Streptomyces sp. NBC_01429 TaxID=2903862 RepID=UPI002E294FE4|nr:pyridoxamine 5'-phosphate oxidase family protein [Streptomyces sp. NBC_01429]